MGTMVGGITAYHYIIHSSCGGFSCCYGCMDVRRFSVNLEDGGKTATKNISHKKDG
jgi:hypothetical protein